MIRLVIVCIQQYLLTFDSKNFRHLIEPNMNPNLSSHHMPHFFGNDCTLDLTHSRLVNNNNKGGVEIFKNMWVCESKWGKYDEKINPFEHTIAIPILTLGFDL